MVTTFSGETGSAGRLGQSEEQLVPTSPARTRAAGLCWKRALEVEHIGPTSVPALGAKHIIDILPVVAYGEAEAA
jgi:hypothetical protein